MMYPSTGGIRKMLMDVCVHVSVHMFLNGVGGK